MKGDADVRSRVSYKVEPTRVSGSANKLGLSL